MENKAKEYGEALAGAIEKIREAIEKGAAVVCCLDIERAQMNKKKTTKRARGEEVNDGNKRAEIMQQMEKVRGDLHKLEAIGRQLVDFKQGQKKGGNE